MFVSCFCEVLSTATMIREGVSKLKSMEVTGVCDIPTEALKSGSTRWLETVSPVVSMEILVSNCQPRFF